MNRDLTELVEKYGTGTRRDVSDLLNSKSKPNLELMLLDLLTLYFNDKNSSALREFLVVTLSGFKPLTEKIGYDGYRCLSICRKEYCEAKPKNIITDKPDRILNGGGNFTDYSWKKFDRHKEENPTMLIAGFIDGRLVYIFSFKFNFSDFTNRIEKQLMCKFPNGDEIGIFLRGASFTLGAYKNANDLDVKVFVKKEEITSYYEDKRLTKDVNLLLLNNL